MFGCLDLFVILGFWGFGFFWDFGIWRFRNFGVLDLWDLGILGFWDFGTPRGYDKKPPLLRKGLKFLQVTRVRKGLRPGFLTILFFRRQPFRGRTPI